MSVKCKTTHKGPWLLLSYPQWKHQSAYLLLHIKGVLDLAGMAVTLPPPYAILLILSTAKSIHYNKELGRHPVTHPNQLGVFKVQKCSGQDSHPKS